jgi:hypothetical protein
MYNKDTYNISDTTSCDQKIAVLPNPINALVPCVFGGVRFDNEGAIPFVWRSDTRIKAMLAWSLSVIVTIYRYVN